MHKICPKPALETVSKICLRLIYIDRLDGNWSGQICAQLLRAGSGQMLGWFFGLQIGDPMFANRRPILDNKPCFQMFESVELSTWESDWLTDWLSESVELSTTNPVFSCSRFYKNQKTPRNKPCFQLFKTKYWIYTMCANLLTTHPVSSCEICGTVDNKRLQM